MTSEKQWCYLYTLVARCRVTGKGKSLVWMITNSESQYPVTCWLQWLKHVHGYQPSKVMIDNSDAEIAAVNMAYNVPSIASDSQQSIVFNNNVKILICHWHLLKAWKKAILTKVTAINPRGKTMEEKKRKRDEALTLTINLINAEDEVAFDLSFEEFELWATENSDEWETPVFFDYFQREYYSKREKWSRCWREVCALSINPQHFLQKQ
jgi:hypothetical protein